MNKIMLLILSLMFCSKTFSVEYEFVGKVNVGCSERFHSEKEILSISKFYNQKRDVFYKAEFHDGYAVSIKSASNEFGFEAYILLQSAGWNYEPDNWFLIKSIYKDYQDIYNFLEKLYNEQS